MKIGISQQKREKFAVKIIISSKQASSNSRYKRFGHLAKFKNGFVLGKFVHNGKNSHL
ncbi:hypothetical protein [Flavobacterium sp. 5]|uniref:hypothetical protein n=1 Tax=Flavobacterium sp. 5 TaxID=2035199 RepID=UPI0018E245D1|nr:hypothetical protein [Flavobacterium sp. 5]